MIRKPRAAPGWRDAFLHALETGKSISQSARDAGIDPTSAHRVRQRDPAFAQAWAAAREAGVARLAAGAPPALAPDEVVRASTKGRPRIQRAGPGRWSAAKEVAFLAELAATGNASAACRAVGLSNAALYQRRARDAGFAARWRDALAQGYHRLEALLLAGAVGALAGPEGDSAEGAEPPPAIPPRMSVDQAITVWRMHQATVTGEGRRPRHDWRHTPASVEEIQEEVLRRVRVVGGSP